MIKWYLLYCRFSVSPVYAQKGIELFNRDGELGLAPNNQCGHF